MKEVDLILDMKMQTDEFLVKNGLEPTITKKVREGVVELKDLPAVRSALNIVQQFQDNPVCSSFSFSFSLLFLFFSLSPFFFFFLFDSSFVFSRNTSTKRWAFYAKALVR